MDVLMCFGKINVRVSIFRTQSVEMAKAEGEKIKKIGAAEAYTIEAIGKAEAERMRMKANVYKSYGEAAIMSLVLEALPKVSNNARSN